MTSVLTLKRTASLTVALFALSACATTNTTTANATADAKTEVAGEMATKTAENNSGDMICKRQTVVGSNFKKKICATQAEWDARAEADRKATQNLQRAKAPGVSN